MPTEVDWRDSFKVTQVWDQGNCGSCWAWATASTIESSILIRENWNYDVFDPSYNQLCCNPFTLKVCCPSCYYGGNWCYSGYATHAFDYCKEHGLHQRTTTDGNWLPVQPSCGEMVYQIKDYYNISGIDVNAIKGQVAQHPCLITIKTYEDFYNYTDGIYSWDGVSDFLGFHCMVIVGYIDAGQYFIVKNSWGSDWGKYGYCKMAYSHVANCTGGFVLSPIQGSYSVSCLANNSHDITISSSTNVNIVNQVSSDNVSDPSNYYIMMMAPDGQMYYLKPNGGGPTGPTGFHYDGSAIYLTKNGVVVKTW